MYLFIPNFSQMDNLWSRIKSRLNFFRIHVLYFTISPLICSGILYAANGENHISYIDALFSCFSASAVCGLLTIDLSSLTGFQQAILFFQFATGNPVVVSWVMVYIRRRYFTKRLKYIVRAESERKKVLTEQREGLHEAGDRENWQQRFKRTVSENEPMEHHKDTHDEDDKKGTRPTHSKKKPEDLHPSAIRANDAPKCVVEELPSSQIVTLPSSNYLMPAAPLRQTLKVDFQSSERSRSARPSPGRSSFNSDIYFGSRSESPTMAGSFRPSPSIIHDDRIIMPSSGARYRGRLPNSPGISPGPAIQESATTKNRGYGGFPYPTNLLLRLYKKIIPGLRRRFARTAATLQLKAQTQTPKFITDKGMDTAQYFSNSFNALVGRNSKFYLINESDLEELGGVEYRALNALLWIIAAYHFTIQLIALSIIAPYMSTSRWRSDFVPPNLHRPVPTTWYSVFQVVSAYTTSGLSLVDQSLVPFQEAYPLLFVCAFLILAGNLAFPVFLRFFIWSVMKVTSSRSLAETLHFLLDHPRRCYMYLFPAYQTWFLLSVGLTLFFIDWFFFLILNIGESAFDSIPLGVRFAIGVLQSTSVRAAGFSATSLLNLSPALQVLYVIVMYLGIYPIAISVHSTNVYEEKSLGVFDEDMEEEADFVPKVEERGFASYGRYMAWHTRRQLSFDMWWLGLALFLFCVIERSKIQNETNYQWFTVFAMIFELISAYSGVGMSMGVPYGNFSFSGALTPLSKIIMITVMIRGRHRGLPVAIDRAIMLPFEFEKANSILEVAAENKEAHEERDKTSIIINIISDSDSALGKEQPNGSSEVKMDENRDRFGAGLSTNAQ